MTIIRIIIIHMATMMIIMIMIITCGDKVLALRSRGGGIGLILFAREGSPGDCHDDDSLLVNDLLMMVMTIQ